MFHLNASSMLASVNIMLRFDVVNVLIRAAVTSRISSVLGFGMILVSGGHDEAKEAIC